MIAGAPASALPAARALESAAVHGQPRIAAPRPPSADRLEQVVIIGGGPAGYTAALYAARASLEPLVIEGLRPGGLLQETTLVENFPGYPDGVLGPQLAADIRDQAHRFGARYLTDDAEALDLSTAAGGKHRIRVGGLELRARTVILAMGARPRTLGIPGEDELRNKGVAWCAVCDAPLFADKDTLVIGGGDSAMEEALGLARHARQVTLVHRSASFRASPIMLERIRREDRINIMTSWIVEAFVAGDGGTLAKARLRSAEGGATLELAATGAFIAIGHRPQSDLVRDQIEIDHEGYVQCRRGTRATSIPSVFACGDLVDARYRQAITASGSGCQAALDAQRHLDVIGR